MRCTVARVDRQNPSPSIARPTVVTVWKWRDKAPGGGRSTPTAALPQHRRHDDGRYKGDSNHTPPSGGGRPDFAQTADSNDNKRRNYDAHRKTTTVTLPKLLTLGARAITADASTLTPGDMSAPWLKLLWLKPFTMALATVLVSQGSHRPCPPSVGSRPPASGTRLKESSAALRFGSQRTGHQLVALVSSCTP